MIYSSSYTLSTLEYDHGHYFFMRQLVFLVLGLSVFAVMSFISLKTLGKLSPFFNHYFNYSTLSRINSRYWRCAE